MRSDAALGPADHPFDGLQVTSCGCRGALAEHQKRLSSITRCPRRQNLSAALVPCQRHFHSRARARRHRTAPGRRDEHGRQRIARAAPPRPAFARARESGGGGVTARPPALDLDSAFEAYARAAPSGRNGRARLDSKRRFTGGAVFVDREASARAPHLRRADRTRARERRRRAQ